jgi:hypothetical protein
MEFAAPSMLLNEWQADFFPCMAYRRLCVPRRLFVELATVWIAVMTGIHSVFSCCITEMKNQYSKMRAEIAGCPTGFGCA